MPHLLFISCIWNTFPSFEQVMLAMTDQSGNAMKINDAMLGLSQEIHQTTESFRETYEAIQLINEAANDLRDQVARFKL